MENVAGVSGILPKAFGVVPKASHVLHRMFSSALRVLLLFSLPIPRANVGVVLSVAGGLRARCRRILVVDGDASRPRLVPRPPDPVASLSAAPLLACDGAAVLIPRTTGHAAAVAVDEGRWSARSGAFVGGPDVGLPIVLS